MLLPSVPSSLPLASLNFGYIDQILTPVIILFVILFFGVLYHLLHDPYLIDCFFQLFVTELYFVVPTLVSVGCCISSCRSVVSIQSFSNVMVESTLGILLTSKTVAEGTVDSRVTSQ